MDLTELTRKHGVKIPPTFPVSVEECSLAVGEVVGHSSVVSAARMNGAVVIFLDSIENAEVVLDNGIEVGKNFLPAYPLSTPAVRITVSNVPPFIRDDEITKELSKYGRIVSKVKKVSSGCKSPLLRHVVSHRRQLHMIPKDRSKGLDLAFKLRVDEFDYILYVTTDDFKCFNCGKVGHQSRTCPGKDGSHENQDQNQNQAGTEKDRGDKQDRQEETGGVRKEKETSKAQEVREKGTSETQEVRNEETRGGQEVREEGTSEAQEVREKGTSETQEVREKGTSETQEVREEETSGVNEMREEETSGEQQVETGREVVMEEDEEQIKAPPLKRKKERHRGSSQAKKVTTKESGGAAESESSLEEDSESSPDEDSESSLEEDSATDREPSELRAGSGRKSGDYSVKAIKEYLRRSKHVKGAQVEDYLSDKEKLSSSVRAHMRSKDRGGFTKQEGYRLKKIAHKVRKELNIDGAK